jgi:hypothetical protein
MPYVLVCITPIVYLVIGGLLVNHWVNKGGRCVSGYSFPCGALFWPILLVMSWFIK